MANKIYAALANSNSEELFEFVDDVFAHFSLARPVKGASYQDISAGDFAEYLMEMAQDHVAHSKPKGVDG